MSNRYQKSPKDQAHFKLLRLYQQQGSSLILALFVIIILTLLGSVLMRMIFTSSETVSQEVLGTRAYMAAKSAMQAELQKLFPLKPIVSISCDVSFFDKPYYLQTALNEDIPGFYDCEAFTSCENYFSDTRYPPAVIKYYRLTSTGKCGSGIMGSNSKVIVKSSRSIQVEARSL